MNRAVVIRAAAGLAAWLGAHVPGAAHAVVGYDARRDSDVFARDTAAVLTAAGVTVAVLPRPLPTPVLAFAVRHLGADAGRHGHGQPQPAAGQRLQGLPRRPADRPGRQIVPPADAEIAAEIAAVGRTVDVPEETDGWSTLDDGIARGLPRRGRRRRAPRRPARPRVVLTPMHGVGGATVVRGAAPGPASPTPYVVPQQAEPDPAFPTVAFPNPEEPGAIDLALAAARERRRRPGDRQRPGRRPVRGRRPGPLRAGGWRMLRGDEVGALLGEHLLAARPRRPSASWRTRWCRRSCWPGSPPLMACSTR